MADQEIGRVVHYYNKAMVVVVRLSADIKLGETIKVVKGDDIFEMKVESMQLNHEPISEGKVGEEVAIKTPNPVKEGAIVYKVEKT